MDHNKLWKILKEMDIPYHLTWLLRNLSVGQEATVRTGHGTIEWLQIRKGDIKAEYCHPAYLTYMQSTSYSADIWNHKAGIKTAGINISKLRYADYTTLIAESEKELMSLLIKVKEESEKGWLKTQH